ncbi:hypothetical protein T4D_4449 [Trichinella pseudospiralis]|uniref:Uncharacterized protein n=1 Tax=Trichinella pseudospiralis TaxID=6337 RepID=A0A0V1FVC0_TRIPS|nr:hypothetical protein T4D_4449 [Trichinella pseudospiralis]
MSKSNFKLYIEPNANFPLLSIITKANKIDANEREKNVEHHGRGVEEEVDEDKVKQYQEKFMNTTKIRHQAILNFILYGRGNHSGPYLSIYLSKASIKA